MEENRKIRRVSTIRVSTKMNVHASFSFLLYIIISYLIISSKEKIEKSFCNPSIQQLLNFHLKLFIFFFSFLSHERLLKISSIIIYRYFSSIIRLRFEDSNPWNLAAVRKRNWNARAFDHETLSPLAIRAFLRARKWPAAKPRLRIRSISMPVGHDLDRSGCICVPEIWRAR